MQQPTKSTAPSELVGKFKGLNDINDSIARPKGSTSLAQNIIDDKVFDANRRPGRDLESLDASGNPVQFIGELEWGDAGVSNINITGSTASYNDITYGNDGKISQTNPSTPGELPSWPSFNFPQNVYPPYLPDYSAICNALIDARKYVNNGTSDLTFPDQVWSVDVYSISGGQKVASNLRNKSQIMQVLQNPGLRIVKKNDTPVVFFQLYVPTDYYWVDYYCDRSLVLNHLNQLITKYNSSGVLYSYLKTWPINGATSLDNYTLSDNFTETPDVNNYPTVATHLAAKINETLVRRKISVSAINVLTKTGQYLSSPRYRIKDFTWSMFSFNALVNATVLSKFKTETIDGSSFSLWDGTFPIRTSDVNPIYDSNTWVYSTPTASGDCSMISGMPFATAELNCWNNPNIVPGNIQLYYDTGSGSWIVWVGFYWDTGGGASIGGFGGSYIASSDSPVGTYVGSTSIYFTHAFTSGSFEIESY